MEIDRRNKQPTGSGEPGRPSFAHLQFPPNDGKDRGLKGAGFKKPNITLRRVSVLYYSIHLAIALPAELLRPPLAD